MRRRRRPNKEIQFSFDSFLDVVANVVGIILRLILVAWAGAKAYKGPPPPPPPPLPVLESLATLPAPKDPLGDDLDQQRQLLLQAQAQLLEHMKLWKETDKERGKTREQVALLAEQRKKLEDERKALLEKTLLLEPESSSTVALTLQEFQKRSQQLLLQIDELRKSPSVKQALRYRTPVSHPVQTEEIHLECLHGRVTVIDVGGLEEAIQREARDKIDQLKTQWEVSDVTSAIGEFRLRYVLMRERDEFNKGSPLPPDPQAGYRYGVAGWEAIPLHNVRGETVEQALKPGSEFRRLMDHIEANQTAVTFWVYSDSYPEYRRLRDFLHGRDIVVAARPMLPGAPIAASRSGSASRGQ